MRNAELKRRTAETDISLSLCLEGAGNAEINSGRGSWTTCLRCLPNTADSI